MIKLCNSENKNFTDLKTNIIMIRNKRRAYKKMATEKGVYNTTYTIHNKYYTKQLTQNFKTA
jgi:hypothetical protein